MALAAFRPVARSSVFSQLFALDRYLTDGKRLFRVASQSPPGAREVFVSLEDCLTLETRAYAPGELDTLALRPVRLPITVYERHARPYR
jgi:hypothetical protein